MRPPTFALAALATACADRPFVPDGAIAIPAEQQRSGDPDAGYDTLINGAYVTCGLPRDTYDAVIGPAPVEQRLAGRDPEDEGLAYMVNGFPTTSGVEVVGANCLTCHAGFVNGELVVGVGASDADFTVDPLALIDVAGSLIPDDALAERAEWQKWRDRLAAVGPNVLTDTVGVNSADNVAAVLFAHRNQDDLAWSDELLLPLPELVVPTDTPPWWEMAKKNAMFYTAGGRGDQARIMMSASALCTDTVAEAEQIDLAFPDVAAYVRSIEPPAFPWPLDEDLVADGERIFERTCSGCHGTYGEEPTYPNLVIPLADIGTDDLLANAGAQVAGDYVDWFNGSFYGELGRFEAEQGYYAPPLDGVWATAPYFHNGSVPTLAAVLDPSLRPTYWSRLADDPLGTAYDPDAGGWTVDVLDHGKDGATDAPSRARIYDTTLPGYGNGGHPFGEPLDDEARAAVVAYLESL